MLFIVGFYTIEDQIHKIRKIPNLLPHKKNSFTQATHLTWLLKAKNKNRRPLYTQDTQSIASEKSKVFQYTQAT